MFRQIFLISLQLTICLCATVRFDNYHVYSIAVENVDQFSILQNIELYSNDYYDFWTSPSIGRESIVMIPPHKFADFEDLTKSLNLSYILKINDLQKYTFLTTNKFLHVYKKKSFVKD